MLASCCLVDIMKPINGRNPSAAAAEMPEEDSGGEGRCCYCCFRFTLTCGITALFLWLALRPNRPTLSIEQFDVFALNSTSNRSTNASIAASNRTIFFDLKLKNRNKDKGVFYDALSLKFSYAPNLRFPVANATFPAFYQGHEHSAQRPLAVEATSGNWMTAAAEAVGVNGSAVFRVDLTTAVRYKVVFWKMKRKRLVLGAELAVNGQGKLVRGKKGVRLTSGAGLGTRCYRALGYLFVVFCLVHIGWGL
ncbi:hypothetical protein V2J09_008431 [Rumex salicifolius]